MRSGQAAYEYLILISVALLIIGPMIFFSLNASASQRAISDGEVAMARIAAAAESVYAQGIGAKQTVTVYLPEASNLAGSSVSGRIVRLRVYSGEGNLYDIVRILPFNVTGALPLTAGYQEVPVEVLATGTVRIGIPPSGPVCGNGIKEGNESCDGPDLGGASCQTIGGFIGGTLACTGTCAYDTSACVLGSYVYVSSDTAHNGTVSSLSSAQSASDGDAAASLTEAGFAGTPATLTLSADGVGTAGSWALGTNTFVSDDLRATTTNANDKLNVTLENTNESGTITSIYARVEQNIVGVTSDEFTITPYIGGTSGTSCTSVGTAADSYIQCNITNGRPSGGAWSFNDINDTRIVAESVKIGAPPTSWNIDHIALAINYTAAATYITNVTTQFTGVPSGTLHTLELRYRVTGDAFSVQVYDGTSYNTRGGALTAGSLATWSYIMTADEYNAGAPQVRFIDATPSGTSQGVLYLEYERIATTA